MKFFLPVTFSLIENIDHMVERSVVASAAILQDSLKTKEIEEGIKADKSGVDSLKI